MELLKDWSYLDKQIKNKLSIKKRKKPRDFGTNPRAKGTNPRAMSKRKSKAITTGKSDKKCHQCSGEMVVRKHGEITRKLLDQYYYFTQWDYCRTCNKVFFNERYKKLNSKGADLEEKQRQETFINSLN